MKKGLTNVDVAALAAELRPILVGSRFQKAYQPDKDAILLRFRQKHLGRLEFLYRLGSFATLVKRPPENPNKPSMVAQILRNTFDNARVTGVAQVGFDRLLRIDMEGRTGVYSVVLEVFGDGNLLILDSEDTIVLPMRGGDYGARRLRKGEPYQPPPGGALPLTMSADELQTAGAEARKDLVRFLALDLGFGPQWGEELSLRSGVAKDRAPPEMDEPEWQAVHDAVQGLAQELERNDLAPVLVYETKKPDEAVDATPWPLQLHAGDRFVHEEAPSWHAALDRFFLGTAEEEEEREDPRLAKFEEAKGKLERQLAQMEGAIDGFREDEADRRLDGDTLYARFQEVQQVLDQLHNAREERSWDEVAKTLDAARQEGHPAAQMVQELQPHTARATLALSTVEGEPRQVTVDLRKSVQENADDHYEASKKARSRREGAGKALAEVRGRLKALEDAGLDAFGEAQKRVKAQQRHFWFENYRWTITPQGFIAVGGRSAGQNDTVVKKYLRDGDRYVHADIHGAPSVVVRPPDGPSQEVPDEDLRIACQFAACASRAWRQFGESSAYWVTPQQVSKTPRSGEFVPRGAWIIHGKRHTEDKLPMQWAVGRVRFRQNGEPVPKDQAQGSGEALGRDEAQGREEADVTSPSGRLVEKTVGGPPGAIEPFCDAPIYLEPGEMDPNEAAPLLAKRLDDDVEAIQQVLPNGPVRILEGRP